jgi:chromate reductase
MSNVFMICGSLRKGSFNRALMNALPALAPADMKLTKAPSFRSFPLYDADLQAKGFPSDVTALADAIRAADAVIIITPEYNYSIPGALKNAIDWVSRLPDQPFKEKPVAIQSATGGPLGGARMPVNSTKRHWSSRTRSKLVAQQLAGFAKFIERVKA